MKFRLFGGLDCPDVVLAQLSVVAGMPVQMVSRFADHVTTVIVQTLQQQQQQQQSGDASASSENQGDYAALHAGFMQSPEIRGMPIMDVGMALSALHALITNITRFGVPHDVATNELSMLGLSSEAAETIVGSTQAYATQLREAQRRKQPRAATISAPVVKLYEKRAATATLTPDETGVASWAVDDEGHVGQTVSLSFVHVTGDGRSEKRVVDMTHDQARALLAELVAARRVMEQHSGTQ